MRDTTNWICYNGRMLKDGIEGIPPLNRAFNLGDGFFESLRITEGEPHLWDAHWARIQACAKALQMEVPAQYSSSYFSQRISELLEHNQFSAGARLRITFFREGRGTYFPTSLRLGFLMEMSRLENTGFNPKEEGIRLGLFKGIMKHPDALANYKLLGGHVYIQAAIWARANGFDDALISNDKGLIIEGSASNLFAVIDGSLHTPDLKQGCVGGVMRMATINAAMAQGIPCFESELNAEDILQADEVFLTNAVQGLMWVRSFGNKRYYHKVSDLLIHQINAAHEAQKERSST